MLTFSEQLFFSITSRRRRRRRRRRSCELPKKAAKTWSTSSRCPSQTLVASWSSRLATLLAAIAPNVGPSLSKRCRIWNDISKAAIIASSPSRVWRRSRKRRPRFKILSEVSFGIRHPLDCEHLSQLKSFFVFLFLSDTSCFSSIKLFRPFIWLSQLTVIAQYLFRVQPTKLSSMIMSLQMMSPQLSVF